MTFSHGMVWIVGALVCPVSLGTPAGPKEIKLERSGIRVVESVRIAPGVYELPDPDAQGAVVIVGDHLTVDFHGATLAGGPTGAKPDAFVGRGIVIRGRNVTLRNANIRGYKVGIIAEDSPGVTISGCNVSGNYRQRLESTVEHERLSDWLYGHENDANEWLRYGAGIYLVQCPDAIVEDSRARNGQNGICLIRCDRARVVDNDMSFMSGWGLAMWRSSQCEVFNNKFDWCIRGYSHGVYSRGQDSAGILVYEQCNRNLFAHNSATHSGDGFFLYAGNETLKKTGRGGCNRNILYRNDFSHAAANGIEATFSDGNIFIENILDECTHGVWAGYSYNTIIENNTISNCANGISIEHGHNNRIAGNTVSDTELGVHLWWDDDEDLLTSAFGSAHQRCPSRENTVIANRFQRVKTAIRLVNDVDSVVAGNSMTQVEVLVDLKHNWEGIRIGPVEAQGALLDDQGRSGMFVIREPLNVAKWAPLDAVAREPRLAAGRGKQNAFLPTGARRGRRYIFVDEWGPYDFSDVRLFPSEVLAGPRAAIQVLGPDSRYRVTNVAGPVKVTPTTGRLPKKLTVEATEPGLHRFAIELGVEDQTLRATGALLNAEWLVQFYAWSEADDPSEGAEAWRRIVGSTPLDQMTVPAIDFMWYWRSPSDKVPQDHFATVATTRLDLPTGAYRVKTVSDDGVRVWVDDLRVIANWTSHAPAPDEARVKLEDGKHEIRVEHFEVSGHAQLQFWMEPAP